MKKYGWVLIVVMLLMLDWAALDDITTGTEPDFYGEYAILIISVVVWGVMSYIVLRRRFKRN